MKFIKSRSSQIILITILCIVPCDLLPEKTEDILAFLSSLPKNSPSVISPFVGKINTQFKPIQQQSTKPYELNPLSLPSSSIGKVNSQIQPIPQKSAKSQETKNSNGTHTIDYFDNNGKNIARIETDARGNTTWFMNFYTDQTQSKTTYNSDGTQTISFFGNDHKNTSTTKLDKNGKTMFTTSINPDKTAIETIYNLDTSQTITLFDTNGKSSSRTEVDARGTTTSITNFHNDGTQTKINYNSDNTQTIEKFGIDKKSSSRTEIDKDGKPIKSIDFNKNGSQTQTTYNQDGTKKIQNLHSDGTQTTTIYHKDMTQTVDHRDSQGKRISLTRVHANGTKISATAKLIVAWHEAAHAISYTHNDTLSLINYITIKPQERIGIDGKAIETAGHVQASRRSQIHTNIEEIDNKIMTAICGAVGEQLLMQDTMLDNSQDILRLLSQPPYADDMLQARQDATKILSMQPFSYGNALQVDQRIDDILVRLYKQAYQFIAKHTSEVKKIADVLIEKETLTTDETYKLLNLKQPWTTA